MKKIGIVSLALGFLAVGLLPRAVSAQANEVTIDIPFGFIVKDTPLPAGTYKIIKVDQWNHRIAEVNGTKEVMFMTQAAKIDPAEPLFTLFFNVYGDTHYLSKIFHQGWKDGYLIPPTDAEKALAQKEPVTTQKLSPVKK